jgi:hypothetical protein
VVDQKKNEFAEPLFLNQFSRIEKQQPDTDRHTNKQMHDKVIVSLGFMKAMML